MLIGYDDLRRKMKKGIKAKVRVIIVRKKVNKTPYFEKNEMEKSPQSKNKTKQNKTKQNWLNHRIGTHWKTPVSSMSPSLLMQIYSG
jgi:hypothetical protein